MDAATIVPVAHEDMGAPNLPEPELRVEVIQEYGAFIRIGPVWNQLVEEAGIEYPFMRHEWVRTWWDCFEHGAKLHIVLVKQGDETIAIAPLMFDRGRLYGCSVRRLRGIANVYTERFDFILTQRPKDACRAIWKYLAAKASDWDVLELRQLPDGARVKEHLLRYTFDDHFLFGSWHSSDGPYIPINRSWEAYLKTLSKKHLSNLRGRMKGLHRVGTVQHEILSGCEQLDRTLNEAFLLEAAAWKGKAGTAILNRPDRLGFYRQLMKRAAERGWMRLHFLTLNGKRIAVQLALQLNNKLYILKSGYDPHYAQFAPSLVLCEMMLHDAWKQNLSEVDFLGDAERWKLDWAGHTRAHSWLFVFPNRPRTRFLHRLKFAVLPRLHQHPLYRVVRDAGRRVGLRVHGD
jgi:CelD/BcsL family acetyltransferase involved in cellulose biosynthesis